MSTNNPDNAMNRLYRTRWFMPAFCVVLAELLLGEAAFGPQLLHTVVHGVGDGKVALHRSHVKRAFHCTGSGRGSASLDGYFG